LNTIRSGIEEQPGFTQQDQESAQVSALEASSTVFNTSIAMMTNVESQISKNYLLIAEINTIATANGVTISQITFQSATTPIQVNGVAQSTDSIAAFKSAIQNDHHFGAVTLPVLNIQQNATNGGYSFSMTFPLSSGF
jgi:Tfp pilus assembly protein PilN